MRVLSHSQPPTQIKIDNITADDIMKKVVKQEASMSMYERFYWLQNKVEQGQFRVFWAPGKVTLADYFTKYHSSTHHRRVRPIYAHLQGKNSTSLQ